MCHSGSLLAINMVANSQLKITTLKTRNFSEGQLIAYRTNGLWCSLTGPTALRNGSVDSYTILTLCDEHESVSFVNAISERCLVVYYADVLVPTTCQGNGIRKC